MLQKSVPACLITDAQLLGAPGKFCEMEKPLFCRGFPLKCTLFLSCGVQNTSSFKLIYSFCTTGMRGEFLVIGKGENIEQLSGRTCKVLKP